MLAWVRAQSREPVLASVRRVAPGRVWPAQEELCQEVLWPVRRVEQQPSRSQTEVRREIPNWSCEFAFVNPLQATRMLDGLLNLRNRLSTDSLFGLTSSVQEESMSRAEKQNHCSAEGSCATVTRHQSGISASGEAS